MTKINLRARFKRQSRIVKEDKGFGIKRSALHTNSMISIIFVFLVFLFPIYPSIASYLNGNAQIDFYRGNIDESSILESYDFNEDTYENEDLFTSGDDYISVNVPLVDERDTSGLSKIINYTVEPGDSISSIANKFQITTRSIISLNNLSVKKILKPGMKLDILPISGILYTVKKGDTISHISKKFNVSSKEIIAKNFSSDKVLIRVGQELIIPGIKTYAAKETPKYININNIKKPTYKKPTYKKSTYKKPTYKKHTYKKTRTKYIQPKGNYYKLRRRRPFSGVRGNCTWYVASYKGVNWRGNANRWLINASRKGHKVVWGRGVPAPGAIVVFNGYGYNPRYGHVGIVMSVNRKAGTMVISDMNYRRLGQVTYRTIKLNEKAIKGYIYVN